MTTTIQSAAAIALIPLAIVLVGWLKDSLDEVDKAVEYRNQREKCPVF